MGDNCFHGLILNSTKWRSTEGRGWPADLNTAGTVASWWNFNLVLVSLSSAAAPTTYTPLHTVRMWPTNMSKHCASNFDLLAYTFHTFLNAECEVSFICSLSAAQSCDCKMQLDAAGHPDIFGMLYLTSCILGHTVHSKSFFFFFLHHILDWEYVCLMWLWFWAI